ncbi:MAG TPA: hypothetical protein P5181_09030 [Dermatophilaceae bacterium]|nr:hypothetical protein [Dermatophilaceae bacterium]
MGRIRYAAWLAAAGACLVLTAACTASSSAPRVTVTTTSTVTVPGPTITRTVSVRATVAALLPAVARDAATGRALTPLLRDALASDNDGGVPDGNFFCWYVAIYGADPATGALDGVVIQCGDSTCSGPMVIRDGTLLAADWWCDWPQQETNRHLDTWFAAYRGRAPTLFEVGPDGNLRPATQPAAATTPASGPTTSAR